MGHLKDKVAFTDDSIRDKLKIFDSKLTVLHDYAHRDTDDYYDFTEKSCNAVRDSLKKELAKLQKKVFASVMSQDNAMFEAKLNTERIDRMYKVVRDDIMRHETLCFELATKFDAQNDLL